MRVAVIKASFLALLISLVMISGCSSSSDDNCELKETSAEGFLDVNAAGSTTINEERFSEFLESNVAGADSSDAALLNNLVKEEQTQVNLFTVLNDALKLNLLDNLLVAELSQLSATTDFSQELSDLQSGLETALNLNFDNELQGLYDGLAAAGAATAFDAYAALSNLLEWDILKKREYLSVAEAAITVEFLQALETASKNHLRALVGQIQNDGLDYQPVYLELPDFNDIVISDI